MVLTRFALNEKCLGIWIHDSCGYHLALKVHLDGHSTAHHLKGACIESYLSTVSVK